MQNVKIVQFYAHYYKEWRQGVQIGINHFIRHSYDIKLRVVKMFEVGSVGKCLV